MMSCACALKDNLTSFMYPPPPPRCNDNGSQGRRTAEGKNNTGKMNDLNQREDRLP